MGVQQRGKDPHTWTIRYDEPVGPGEPRKRIRLTFKGTAKEAQAKYAKLLDSAKRGVATGNRGRTLFAKFADEWNAERRSLVMLRSDDELAGYTVTNDTSRVVHHIKPVLGKYRIEQIGPKEIETAKRVWKTTPLKRGGTGTLAPKTVSNIYGTLRKMLDDAVKWNYIEWNPCDRVEPPPGGTRKIIATSLADLQKLVAYPSLAPVHVAAITIVFTGFRRGEMLALQREDLDLDQATLWCEKAVSEWEKEFSHKDVKTKNERGRKLQPLVPFIHALLGAYVANNPGITGPLFCARGQDEHWSAKGIAWTPRAYSSALDRHMKMIGIKATAQTLRHAFNSLMGAAGVDLALRAVLMGHSNSSRLSETTYQTFWLEQKRTALAALETLIFKAEDMPAFDRGEGVAQNLGTRLGPNWPQTLIP